ncbi:glutathione S-transferase family protein [Erythrobacter rubeus]|uniref:Glutathione S-transferase family protein n=1 Tax=Erythrobacter rubeus TaxID=2760803 RepID=A0ABR8KR55_9SPHN|nr:glutathione S-transferase family protein [Erythrobacter rubeus]MBD2843242.1 glutathione S-transferase family protein [Erythrobacter rubeus]
MAEALTLHEDPRSGNCYKIKLTAALLSVPLETRQYDILKGETRTDAFKSNVNAQGRIPVLQIGDRYLPESNAACWYLAEGTRLIPEDRFERAQMLRWMFFEQYSHEPNIATLRFWCRFVGSENLSDQQREQMMAKRIAGEDALAAMEAHLSSRDWMAGSSASLADVALFAYTHVADEGGFDLSRFPAIGRWIERVPTLDGFIPMT